MKILFIGDVVSSCGRNMLAKSIAAVRRNYGTDATIVNGENAAHGKGLTLNTADELFALGVGVITTGNHVWGNKEIYNIFECNGNVLRPANMPRSNPGAGYVVCEAGGVKIGVLNLIGRTFMEPNDCPFAAADEAIAEIKKQTNIIIVDFHAEATSEKVALGWYLDGRVSAVLGTHTHIQTADERVLPGKTAYITDVGMTGAYYSVLGMERKVIIDRFTTRLPQRFVLADGAAQLCGVVVDIDTQTGHAQSIERIFLADV